MRNKNTTPIVGSDIMYYPNSSFHILSKKLESSVGTPNTLGTIKAFFFPQVSVLKQVVWSFVTKPSAPQNLQALRTTSVVILHHLLSLLKCDFRSRNQSKPTSIISNGFSRFFSAMPKTFFRRGYFPKLDTRFRLIWCDFFFGSRHKRSFSGRVI